MRGALDVHRDLLTLDVPHEVVRVRGSVLVDADDQPRALGVPATSCLAVRCYVTDLGLVAVAVHAGVLPDPAAVLDALSAVSLRVATADEVNAATDYAAGLVSPVGLPDDVPLLVDEALARTEVVYAPLGETGVVLGIRMDDLMTVVRPVTAVLSAPVQPPADSSPQTSARRQGARVIDLDARGGSRRTPRRSVG